MAEPSPARWGPTAFITAAVIGAIVAPMPWPMITSQGSIFQYCESAWSMSPRNSRPVPARISP